MDPSEFKAPEAGRVVTTPEGYAAFVPAPLPPEVTFTPELALALSRADAALGALSGLGDGMPSPEAMSASFLRQEALYSTRIEGPDVGLREVLLDESAAAPPGSPWEQLAKVRNALAALMYGFECVAGHPLDLGLIRSLHAHLLHGETSTARTPGEFRRTQNWIGPSGAALEAATYVPPPVPQMLAALDQLESFMDECDKLPDLVQCAMVHAQFESIHPFVGGNGRLGRILIPLFLARRGRLSQPLLYVSAYLEAHRREYYTLLQRVRTRGEWLPWLLFFLEAVRETAERAYEQARALLRQRAYYAPRSDEAQLALLDDLFVSPFLAVRQVRRALSMSDGAARRLVASLVDRGLLAPVPGTTRPRLYVAQSILDAIERPVRGLVDETREPHAEEEEEPLKSWLGRDRRPRYLADRLMMEAMAIVDVARAAGADVRLAGGLAVRRYCVDLGFIDRKYSDVDLVGVSQQAGALIDVFAGLGYAENTYVSQATGGQQLQFVKVETLFAAASAEEAGGAEPAEAGDFAVAARPLVDHVDVFLDVLRMDHDVDIRGRLEIDDYAISPVDALIAKTQIGRINPKDVHDVIALLKDVPLRETDDDLSICVPRIAEVCAADWGLYTDITANLNVILDWLPDYGLTEEETSRVQGRVKAVLGAVEREEKTTRWRMRARVGKLRPWRREIQDQDGTPVVIGPV